MTADVSVTPLPPRSRWQFTIRGLFLLGFSVALGFSYWTIAHNWYTGAVAAIAFWVVLGLLAQARDLLLSLPRGGAVTPEERCGCAFAAGWRVLVAGVIVALHVVAWLSKYRVLELNDSTNSFGVSSRVLDEAMLFCCLIVAMASSPRSNRRRKPSAWSRLLGVLGVAAAIVYCAILLLDRLLMVVLVHLAVSRFGIAQPLRFWPDILASYGEASREHFFHVATAAVASLLASCGLVRSLALSWRRGRPTRLLLGALAVAGLAATVALTVQIAVVEAPRVSPLMAASIPVPTLHQCIVAVSLVCFLATLAARRWTETPAGNGCGVGWRREPGRYHHERRLLALALGLVVGASLCPGGPNFFGGMAGGNNRWMDVAYSLSSELRGPLFFAIIVLGVQSVFGGWSLRPETPPPDRPRMAMRPFVLVWPVMMTLIACAGPILAAWGFALTFCLGVRF